VPLQECGHRRVFFKFVGRISDAETIASGKSVRERARLRNRPENYFVVVQVPSRRKRHFCAPPQSAV